MKALTFDTSCVLNLLRLEEAPDEALLRVLRMGLEGRVSIAVTPVAAMEVPSDGADYVRERLRAFPIRDVSSERGEEHERMAGEIARALWPNASPTSAKSDHNRRDSLHLAAHRLAGASVFVTRDEVLRKKVARHASLGVVAQSPLEVAQELELEARATAKPWRSDIAVRAVRDDDGDAIRALLEPVADLYPAFDEWLSKTLHSKDTRVALGIVEGKLAGISVWKPKDRRVAKLATFFVAQDYRQEGLGPHLLFHQIREWVDARIEKVVVTVAARLCSILPFFLQYGFRIEGLAGRRYRDAEAEVVLAKHFFYQRVPQTDLESFARTVATLWTPPASEVVRASESWFVPPMDVRADAVALGATGEHVELRDVAGALVRSAALGELEELLYPARLAIDSRKAFMIPIQPRWASRMMQAYEATPAQTKLFPDAVDKLLLRTDNAYYCFPRYGPQRLNHAPVLFYVSGDVGAVTGMARVLECYLSEPESLFIRFGDIGAFKLSDIRAHVQKNGASSGKAMALRFGWWVPFPRAVKLAQLRGLGLAHPQSITALSFEKYEAILATGGLDW